MNFSILIDEVNQIRKRTTAVYIYGAGFYGKDVYRALKKRELDIDGFVVSSKFEQKEVLGLPVYLASDVISADTGVILGVSDTYVDEITANLSKMNVASENIINGGKFITDTGGREDLRDSKVLEVSTIMGCRVNCHYCPQNLFLQTYYKDNKNRQRVMTLDDFKVILEHTPQDCIIDFSGMTEPFNNPNCIDMIEMACNANRKVYLFTTLSEVSEEIVDRLIELPIYYMTLHVADIKGYAYIPTTDEYYRNVEKVIHAKKKNGNTFVDFINAQTDPDPKVELIVQDQYEVMRSVQNRAGNVEDNTAQHRASLIQPGQKMSCCFCGEELSNSVVLPDGTMLLCNMDYGMKHVLGNLYEEDYDTLRSKGELQKILKTMKCEEDMDELLCRSCLLARVEE